MQQSKILVSCKIFEKELKAILPEESDIDIIWLEAALHCNLHRLEEGLEEALLAANRPGCDIKILYGKSMFEFDRKLNFFSSSIVAAAPCIAAGVAWALKMKGNKNKVWCFIGDGAEDEGHFYEAVRYVDGWDLPCNFIIEDNDRNVSASKKERRGNNKDFPWPHCTRRYSYVPTYPHGGNGRNKWIEFKKQAQVVNPPAKLCSDIPTNIKSNKNIKYFEAVKESMEKLAKEQNTIFIGYNVKYGSAYNSLKYAKYRSDYINSKDS